MIETVEVTGRTKTPLRKKLNPLWWFLNDPEPLAPDWYDPGQPQWLRQLRWHIRNPLVNFNDYVIGVCDRNYKVTGIVPVIVPDWIDAKGKGFKWSIIRTWIPRPFISYTGKKNGTHRVLWHLGWEPGGNLAFKFNLTKD